MGEGPPTHPTPSYNVVLARGESISPRGVRVEGVGKG
jgi:hypothetical protein